MAKITTIPSECPQCGGPVWDNTKKPKRNPKAPDAACKDKENCRWAGWLDTPKAGGSGPRVTYTWDELGKAYQKCRQIAERIWKDTIVAKDPSTLVAATATLWIAAKDCGLKVEATTATPPRETSGYPGSDHEPPNYLWTPY